MALFATQMLISDNYSGMAWELLVSHYYMDDCAFAMKEPEMAIDERDTDAALKLWEFGKDSCNSYISIVNWSNNKVGDKVWDDSTIKEDDRFWCLHMRYTLTEFWIDQTTIITDYLSSHIKQTRDV